MTDAFDGDGGAADDAAEDAKNSADVRRDPRRAVRAARVVRSRKWRHHRHRPRRRDGHPAREPTIADRAPARAEAFTSIARWYLAADLIDGTQRPPAANPPERHRATSGARGDHPDVCSPRSAPKPPTRRGLSRSTLERIACDCKFSRVLMDGRSQVLDVGRITRNIPTPLWNALVARDKHCTHPGCDRPPGLLRSAPHHLLDPRRRHQPRKPPPLVLVPPPRTPPRRQPRPRPPRIARSGESALGWRRPDPPEKIVVITRTEMSGVREQHARVIGLFGFQRGVMVASRSQLGLPA